MWCLLKNPLVDQDSKGTKNASVCNRRVTFSGKSFWNSVSCIFIHGKILTNEFLNLVSLIGMGFYFLRTQGREESSSHLFSHHLQFLTPFYYARSNAAFICPCPPPINWSLGTAWGVRSRKAMAEKRRKRSPPCCQGQRELRAF